MLNYALAYLEKGWSVIPVKPDKRPYIRWSKYQKTKPTKEEVTDWWTQWPTANIAVVTGKVSNLLVVDIDGPTDLTLPATLVSKTGGGGRHYFYSTDEVLPNAVRIAKNVDIRAEGGYVIIPPSIHASGKAYTWNNKNTPATCPSSIKRKLLDKVVAVGTRNDSLATLVGRLLRTGLDENVIIDTALSWNVKNCSPPLKEDEVITTVRSVIKTDSRNHPKKAKEENFNVVDFKTVASRYSEGPQWDIEDWLPKSTLGLVVAPPGTFKTWVLLDLALSIATGKKFLDSVPVLDTGKVLIIQQEDPFPLLISRITQILKLKEPDDYSFQAPPDLSNIVWHTDRVLNFANQSAVDGLCDYVVKNKTKLIIIDPLYSVIETDDYMAKGAQHMLIFKQLRDKYGVSFMIAHHTKKRVDNVRSRDDAWGSQFLNAWLETGWQIRPMTDMTSSVYFHRHFKSSGTVKPVTLEFDITEDAYNVTIEQGVDIVRVDDKLAKLVEIITKNKIKTVREAVTLLGEGNPGTVNRLLKAVGAVKGEDGYYTIVKYDSFV